MSEIKIHSSATRWYRRVQPNVKDFFHFRTDDPYRDPDPKWPGIHSARELLSRTFRHPEGTCHIGVVVLNDGSCYAVRVRESKTPYNRRHWYAKASGRAMKAATAGYYTVNTGSHAPTFTVDLEVNETRKALYLVVTEQLTDMGWL